jgi:hypothetical protein
VALVALAGASLMAQWQVAPLHEEGALGRQLLATFLSGLICAWYGWRKKKSG